MRRAGAQGRAHVPARAHRRRDPQRGRRARSAAGRHPAAPRRRPDRFTGNGRARSARVAHGRWPHDQAEPISRCLLDRARGRAGSAHHGARARRGARTPPGRQPDRRSRSRSFAGAARIADIGAGAGFPGLRAGGGAARGPVDLIEATRRKCEVIDRLAAAAGVDERPRRGRPGGGAGPQARARGLRRGHRSRAGARWRCSPSTPRPCCARAGCWWRGRARRDEGEEARARLPRRTRHGVGRGPPVEPFAGARDRHLHVLRKTGPRRTRFPRRAGDGPQAAPRLTRQRRASASSRRTCGSGANRSLAAARFRPLAP